MPYYELNSFSGRLKESTKFQPLYPISPIKLQKSEPPAMIWDSVKTKPVPAVGLSGVASYSSGLDPSIHKKRKYYQENIHKPIYTLGGTRAKVLYYSTWALTGICTLASAKFVYEKTIKKQ